MTKLANVARATAQNADLLREIVKVIVGRGLTLLLFAALAFCGPAPTQADEHALKPGESFKDCTTDCPEMIVVRAGSFAMGSTADEAGHKPTEEPQHNVTIAKPFAVSKFEVTFAEWDACAAHGDCTQHRGRTFCAIAISVNGNIQAGSAET